MYTIITIKKYVENDYNSSSATTSTVLISGTFFYFFCRKRLKSQGGRAVSTLKAINIVIIMRPSIAVALKYHLVEEEGRRAVTS